jgi:hypothetical protein
LSITLPGTHSHQPAYNRRCDPQATTTTTNHNNCNHHQHVYLTQQLSLRRCTPPTDTSSTSFSTAAQTSEPMRTAAVCRTAAGFSLRSSRPCAKPSVQAGINGSNPCASVQAGINGSNPCARLREHIWFETLSLVWKCVPEIDIVSISNSKLQVCLHRRRTLAPSLLSHHCCDRRGVRGYFICNTVQKGCRSQLSLTRRHYFSAYTFTCLFFHSAARTYVCVCFRCGVRLSPHRNGDVYDTYNGCRDPDPDTLYAHAVSGLDKLGIACVALFHPRFVQSFGVPPPPPTHTHTHASSRARAHTSELTHAPAQSRILVRLHARMHAGTCC